MDLSKIAQNLIYSVAGEKVSEIKPQLDAHGIRLVGIGLEKLGLEAFTEGGFFKGDLFVDEGKQLFKALQFKRYSVLTIAGALVASETRRANAKSNAMGITGNMKGDGMQLGGTLVVEKGGEKVLLFHKQKNPGDHTDVKNVLEVLGISVAGEAADSSTAAEATPAVGDSSAAEGAAAAENAAVESTGDDVVGDAAKKAENIDAHEEESLKTDAQEKTDDVAAENEVEPAAEGKPEKPAATVAVTEASVEAPSEPEAKQDPASDAEAKSQPTTDSSANVEESDQPSSETQAEPKSVEEAQPEPSTEPAANPEGSLDSPTDTNTDNPTESQSDAPAANQKDSTGEAQSDTPGDTQPEPAKGATGNAPEESKSEENAEAQDATEASAE